MMNILVTGAAGFVGKNLVASLKNIQQKKDGTRPGLVIGEIYEYDRFADPALLDGFCKNADFVFNLAGVNRPKNQEDFMAGNFGFSSLLLNTLKKYQNRCPVMLASSIQASLTGRYADSDYGRSKLAGEKLFFSYGKETGAKVLVYRFPNLFGKWCRPNYNSVVATFCHNVANDLPIQVNDPSTELEFLYIDDLIRELLDALEGKEHSKGGYCHAPITHRATLGEIAEQLISFREQPRSLIMPEIPTGSFVGKLYSTYLSYLPEESMKSRLKMNCDERGSFTELLKTAGCGQFSVNVSKPQVTKGQHWHHSKWEIFMVVSGHGKIREQRVGMDKKGNPYPVREFEVSGEKIEAVYMLPGYTHSITNLSDSEDLVTVMWANESFDADFPDTFSEQVGNE